jgi:hypothetical protein
MAAVLIWLGAFWRVEPPLARKPTDPELFKRAAEFMRRAVGDCEREFAPHLRNPQLSGAKPS